MGEMQVGVANIDDKGYNGLMEDRPVKAAAAASSNPSLQVSISFGRFESDSLSWEKFSAFSPNKYLEEVGKCATPGSVAQKKAYFEAHYKKIAERKAEIMDQEKQMDKNASFRSFLPDQGNLDDENGESVEDPVADDGSNNEQFTCEEDKHVTDIAAQVNEETIIAKECQSSVDQVKEVKDNVEEKPEVVVHVQEKPEEVLQVENEAREEVRDAIPSKDTNETPMKEAKKEKKLNLIKKNDPNVRINPTRNSPRPNLATKKPTTNRIVTSKKTPPSKEVRSIMKSTKKPAAPISIAPPPRVYKQKPASQITSLSTSHSSVKKENVSNKQTAPKSLHISMNLGPSASDPTALTNTRKSLIMERMGDKDIVKRAFKSFQKSFDFTTSSVDGPNTALKQNPAKATSTSSVTTRQKENGRNRPTKASVVEKTSSSNSHGLKSNVTAEKQQKELSKPGARPVDKTRLQKNPKAGVIDAKTRNTKAKPMQGSLLSSKGSLDKVL